MGKALAQGVYGSVATYESVLMAHGFHPEPNPYGTRYIVPDGDFGFHVARPDPKEPGMQTVTAFLALPGMERVDANPKWGVPPDGIAALIPELHQWATWARLEYRTNGH